MGELIFSSWSQITDTHSVSPSLEGSLPPLQSFRPASRLGRHCKILLVQE